MSKIREALERRREIYASMSKEPLRVRIALRTPVAVSDYIMLDALLAYRVIMDLFSGPIPRDEAIHMEELDVPLPLEERGRERRYWAASAGVFDCPYSSVTVWHKRWHEEDDWVKFRGAERISQKSGYFRSYAMPLRIIPATEVEFWAFGCKEEVERLLAGLASIGKKRSQGFGEVRAVDVRCWHEDWSCFCEHSVMRPLPLSEVDTPLQGEIRYMPWRPPYWHTVEGKMTECYVP
jgi:hypothetical protein